MLINPDYLKDYEVEQIKKIAKEKDLFLYQIGHLCGIQDKGFWSRIMSGKKPIPEAARNKLNNLLKEET